MKNYLKTFEQQIIDGLEIGRQFSRLHHMGNVRNLLFCGMGGSAMSGDILRALISRHANIPFVGVHRQGKLPQWVNRNTCAIFSSYSGNTQETLASLKDAIRAKAQILIVTSGGKFAQIAWDKRLPCVIIPSGMPPRCALGYLTFAAVPFLRKSGWLRLTESEIKETISVIRNFQESRARSLAKRLKGRSVHLYGVSGFFESIVNRWRCQFAENSKMLVSHQLLPEMFHNEIEGWVHPVSLIKKSAAVFLNDRTDDAKVVRNRKIAQSVIRGHGAEVINIDSRAKSPVARLFDLIYLGDWTSYELALLHGVDPVEIPAIDRLKRK